MVTVSEVEQLLALSHETRSFEVKGPGGVGDKAFCARVARAMAMGNLRDGGLVCLGIDDSRMADMLPGLSQAQVLEWSDFDNVSPRYGPVHGHLDVIPLAVEANLQLSPSPAEHPAPAGRGAKARHPMDKGNIVDEV